MSKIHFLVDGFNLYHALNYLEKAKDHDRYHKYKWMSLTKLCSCFITKKDTVSGVDYFTTLVTWDMGKVARHKLFIKAQENEGVNVIYGEWKRKTRWCKLCHRHFPSKEEKQTDVNIALRLFQLAVQDRYEKAIIISGDTDMIPAVKAVQTTFPNKEIGVVIPIAKASEDLKKVADFHYKMKEKHLKSSTYSDPLILSDGTSLACPPTWK
jgi:uncharacterized LabA/DUF88 family protein